jgi:RNA polymerase sigma-70 factor (ECF subfamily)
MTVTEGGRDRRDAEDRGLLARVGRRDGAAHRELFERYYARVYAFALRRLGDAGLSEELVADVFFEVWRSGTTFQGGSRVSTWIFGIAHFKCMRASRDRRRAKRDALLPTADSYLQAVPDERDLEAQVNARGELGRVESALEQLPSEQREVLRMAVLDGLDYAEIAQRTGVSEGTVKSRVARARARLRRQLGGRAEPGS